MPHARLPTTQPYQYRRLPTHNHGELRQRVEEIIWDDAHLEHYEEGHSPRALTLDEYFVESEG